MDAPRPASHQQMGQEAHLAHLGLSLAIDQGDGLGLHTNPVFEPEVAKALECHIKPGTTVVDAGAHIGYFTLQMARLVGEEGKVHAFEPEEENLRVLRQNIASNRLANVEVHAVALGEREESGRLYRSDYSTGMHRLYDSLCCGAKATEVVVRRLDAIFRPGQIALLKIDIEGYEPFALAGARSLIQGQAMVVVSEYCPPAMLEAGALIGDYLAWMKRAYASVVGAGGVTVSWLELEADARSWETFGRMRLRDACAGKTNPEIAATVGQISRDLHCARPFIENLVFIPRLGAA